MIAKIFAVLALVAVVSAQENPCCTPASWQGQRGGLGAEVFTLAPKLVGISEVTYYDYANNRLRLDINITSLSGSEQREATEIYRYDLGKLFVIENGQCEVRPLNGSMEAFCVPAGATKRGEATLGLSLNTAAWSFTDDDVAFELIVSTEACVPVVQAAANTQRIQERAVADLWLNITAPIANPAVFLPPSICRSSNEVAHFDLHTHIKSGLVSRLRSGRN